MSASTPDQVWFKLETVATLGVPLVWFHA